MLFFLAFLLAGLVAAPVVEARMHAPYRAHRITPASGALGTVSAPPSAAYSFRKLRPAYGGAAVRLRRASDSAESDIGFSGSGDFDTATATTFCAATSCFIRTWYDQSGNGRDAVQATPASQPALVFNCLGTLPCAQTTAAQNVASVSAALVPVLPTSFSAVGNRNAGAGVCSWPAQFNANYLRTAAANTWELFGSLSRTAVAADNAWHAGAGVINGASSVVRIDATETAGLVTGLTVAGQFVAFWGAASTTCSATEVIVWDGYALTPAERVALTANQRSYWMPQPLDGFVMPSVAFSLRKLLSTAVSTRAVRLRRASDNAEQDIGFVGNDFDTASAMSFCAATTCFVRTMYDQTLTGRDAVQATAGNQPELVFSCLGSQPCVRTTIGVSQLLSSTSYTPSSTVMSMNGVSKRVTGTGACYVVAGGLSNRIQHTNGSAGYTLLANAGVVASAAGATENVWHSVTGILNGGSSSLVWDTTTVAGSGTATAASAQNVIAQGAVSTTCHEVEAIWWDATALTAQQAADLNANQRAYWGF